MIQTDNVTVAAYINKQGGTHSIRLNQVAMQFLEWCHVHTIVPTATYLPGQDNFVADFLSRGKTLPSEWTLNPAVMVQVLEMSGPLQVDLFASSLNHQLPIYCSRAKDPKAWKKKTHFHSVGVGSRHMPSLRFPSYRGSYARSGTTKRRFF